MVLGRASDGLALRSESTELWYRRTGHINHMNLDVLRSEPESGVDYTGDLQNCSTCPLGKSAHQLPPKQATYNVLRPSHLVFVDTLGPFTPESLGGLKKAVKFVDQQTKSHPTVSVAVFGSKRPWRFSFSCNELPVTEVNSRVHTYSGLRHRSLVGLFERMHSIFFLE